MNNARLLPPGVHNMSLEKVGALFGSYQQNDQRPRLFAKFEELVIETKAVGLVCLLIINGSFGTSKPAPGDLDLIIVVEPGILDQREWAPRECILRSRNRLRRKYPFAVFVMPLASTAYNHYLDFFAKVKGNPGGDQKGVVRVHRSRSGATTQPSWKARAINRCSSQDYAGPASVAPDAVANQAGGSDGAQGRMIPVGDGWQHHR